MISAFWRSPYDSQALARDYSLHEVARLRSQLDFIERDELDSRFTFGIEPSTRLQAANFGGRLLGKLWAMVIAIMGSDWCPPRIILGGVIIAHGFPPVGPNSSQASKPSSDSHFIASSVLTARCRSETPIVSSELTTSRARAVANLSEWMSSSRSPAALTGAEPCCTEDKSWSFHTETAVPWRGRRFLLWFQIFEIEISAGVEIG
jgi:hypothetical protein